MCRTKSGIRKLLEFIIFLPLPLLITPNNTFGAEAERSATGKPATKADFALEIKDNFVSLKATDASLIEVLEEIGRRMKIEVVAPLPEQEKITTEFEKLPLEEAIKRLSGNYSHLIVSQEDGRISKIVVLEKGKETALSKPAPQESEIKKEERSVKTESKMKAEASRKESPPPEPFKFEFDPSRYGEKRR